LRRHVSLFLSRDANVGERFRLQEHVAAQDWKMPPPLKYGRCPICGFAAAEVYTGRHHADCIRCGRYTISSEASAFLEAKPLDARQIANASGYIRENPGITIIENSLMFLRALRAPSVAERATKLLTWLARQHPAVGEKIQIPHGRHVHQFLERSGGSDIQGMNEARAKQLARFLDPIAVSSSVSPAEVDFLIGAYLKTEEQFVELDQSGAHLSVTITARGWKHLDALPAGTSSVGFVAMWFADEMTPVWEQSFNPAITDAGYKAQRIDKEEHNNKIDDEILASIRAAKFVVADFTKQRGGVYYEAGFAQGLGKPIIWTIRQDDLKDIHFDTRQFNHIPWEFSALTDFKLALQRRIEASFGRGPLTPE
jgi:nucleoside 2-deoxyribosyltransferase